MNRFGYCSAVWFMATLFSSQCGAAVSSFLTPVVVDSQGKIVGPLADSYGVAAVAIQPGLVIQSQLSEKGFAPDSYNVNILYLSTDCTGQGYYLGNTALSPTGHIYPSRPNTIYYGNGQVIRATTQSSNVPGSACDNGPRRDTVLVPVRTISVRSLGFTPPFKVEAR